MFYIDTVTLSIDAFDFEGVAGTISNRRSVVTLAEGAGWYRVNVCVRACVRACACMRVGVGGCVCACYSLLS